MGIVDRSNPDVMVNVCILLEVCPNICQAVDSSDLSPNISAVSF